MRWAGGKRWFVKYLNFIAPTIKYKNYHEPFVGSGVLFFHLKPNYSVYLSDLNSDLIETYLAIKEEVEKVIGELKKFKNTEEDYYKIRACKYLSEYKRAARFIYLNQTSFNGIYRVNLNGEYNVPFGYRKKEFYDPENLRAVSAFLQKATIKARDFEKCLIDIKKHDLVFLDPPYTVTHNNNGFFKYNKKLFSLEDQYRLSKMIDLIKEKEAYYILTNSAHKKVESIFDKGDSKIKLSRASLIGGINAKRGQYEELVFTNLK